jgi:hypothetical protein
VGVVWWKEKDMKANLVQFVLAQSPTRRQAMAAIAHERASVLNRLPYSGVGLICRQKRTAIDHLLQSFGYLNDGPAWERCAMQQLSFMTKSLDEVAMLEEKLLLQRRF